MENRQEKVEVKSYFRNKIQKKFRNFWTIIGVLSLSICLIFIFTAFTIENHEKRFDSYYETSTTNVDSLNFVINDLHHQIDSIENHYTQLHKLTWDNINFWLDYYEIKHKEVVKAQIMLETHHLSSTICVDNRNLFGMKEAKKRKTTAKGTRHRHAYYNNYIESIEDYKLWQDYFYTDSTENYISFLMRVQYAEAKHYDVALLRILNQFDRT